MLKRGYHTLRFALNLARDLAGTLFAAARRHRGRIAAEPKELIIGFDATPFLEPLTGVGGYAWSLLREFAGRPGVRINLYGRLFVPGGEGPGLVVPAGSLPGVRLRCHGVPLDALPSPGFWMTAGNRLLAPLFVLFDRNDVFFSPNFFPPPSLGPMGRRVATVHDCTFRVHPDFLQEETLANLERHLPPELYAAHRIVGVSENTRRDLTGRLGLSPVRCAAIPNGFSPPVAGGVPPDPPKRPYVLFVSTLEPRKNVLGLLEAYRLLRRDGWDLGLVLVGRMGWRSGPLRQALDRHPFRADILHLAYLPADRLAGWYREALCLAFPSYYEGFGLPVLEAMAAGCPVVTTPLSSMPEVGGDACLYAGPDPGSLATALARLSGDPSLREELTRRGLAQAARFSWSPCAERTLAVLREAAWA